jgi:CRISPR/Cas system CSM-associated protein Csm3 (group 7 of RAMP superfamily)
VPERRLDYSLTFSSPVGVFTGLGIAGLVDRFVMRDAGGLPYVPGSTVKGRLRFFAERLLAAGGAPAGLWIHDPGHPHCKRLENACTVCRLFGNPSLPGLLRIGHARLVRPGPRLVGELLDAGNNPVVHADAEVRPGVALSRSSRTAFADHLFFDETVPAAAHFAGTLVLGAGAGEERFLIAVGALVDALGARKAAGRGRLDGGVRIEEARR